MMRVLKAIAGYCLFPFGMMAILVIALYVNGLELWEDFTGREA